MTHPLEALRLEAPFFGLGAHYSDPVRPEETTGLTLRWRNPDLLERLGLTVSEVRDGHLLEAFGRFVPLPGSLHGPLAQRYIGFQFRVFNPHLGDGRGFLLAQARARDGTLLDLGTKGSGTTPYSRGGDGRLTLKGGVREIIAAEFLHALGVKTSRALTAIEHDEKLWRGDEPSPTRSSILVRVGESHLRFGTFERIFYLERDGEQKRRLLTELANHVVQVYYPHLEPLPDPERYVALFDEVVGRCAVLVASWFKAGFAHGVLNTDNMNITGDSFDYGPFAFIEHYDPEFTAAYFDETGLYAFDAQPDAVYWNLAMLARPFGVLAPPEALQVSLDRFPAAYREALCQAFLPRLGFEYQGTERCQALVLRTLELLRETKVHYHGFFAALTDRVLALTGREGGERPLEALGIDEPHLPESLWRGALQSSLGARERWARSWRERLEQEPAPGCLERVGARMRAHNPRVAPYRSEIERVWEPIAERDDWGPLYAWLERLRAPFLDVGAEH